LLRDHFPPNREYGISLNTVREIALYHPKDSFSENRARDRLCRIPSIRAESEAVALGMGQGDQVLKVSEFAFLMFLGICFSGDVESV
jgi:hypothetical protein